MNILHGDKYSGKYTCELFYKEIFTLFENIFKLPIFYNIVLPNNFKL